MRYYRPQFYDATVVLLLPEGAPLERVFRLEEGLLPQAAEFLDHLDAMRVHATNPELFSASLEAALSHCLRKPLDNLPVLTGEELRLLTPSIQQNLLDDQSELYGFRGEENHLGKKLRPLLDVHWRLKASLLSESGSGPIVSTSAPESTGPAPALSGENGLGDSSHTTSSSVSETSGEPPRSDVS